MLPPQRNEKDPKKNMEKQGVYMIPVERKDTRSTASYIGVTTRTLAQRIEEHKVDLKKERLTTVLATEAYSSDLMIKWEEMKIIRLLKHSKQAVTTETIEIRSRQNKECLLNDRTAIDLPRLGTTR